MIVHMKKFFIVIPVIVFLLSASVGVYLHFFRKNLQSPLTNQTTHPPCLSDNETVDYTINWRQYTGPVDIIIKDEGTGKEIYKFIIESVLYAAYPIQPRRCGVYVLRIFDYDPTNIIKSASKNRYEIWYYAYNGEGQSLLFLGKDFNLEFSVDFLEIYLALIKGYLGREDFATVIKEITTRNDVFSLEHKDIVNKYPDLIGVFGLDGWTKDSRYFWGRISYGANVLGYFRIERDTWKVDILPVSERILGGTAFNPEYGYVTYDTGPGWIGIDVIAEQIYDEWRKEGKKIDFYLYNLFTKEKTLLATVDDPSWSFKPHWLSDTELEYELPTGEKKVYKINE